MGQNPLVAETDGTLRFLTYTRSSVNVSFAVHDAAQEYKPCPNTQPGYANQDRRLISPDLLYLVAGLGQRGFQEGYFSLTLAKHSRRTIKWD